MPVKTELSEGARNLLLACYSGAYILADVLVAVRN